MSPQGQPVQVLHGERYVHPTWAAQPPLEGIDDWPATLAAEVCRVERRPLSTPARLGRAAGTVVLAAAPPRARREEDAALPVPHHAVDRALLVAARADDPADVPTLRPAVHAVGVLVLRSSLAHGVPPFGSRVTDSGRNVLTPRPAGWITTRA